MLMKQFTVRGIPEDVQRRIMKESKEKGVSLNKAIISLLEKEAGTAKGHAKKPSHHDLDHLFGVWKKGEWDEFEKNLELQREVDKDLWTKSG
jgi:hypothetical protein